MTWQPELVKKIQELEAAIEAFSYIELVTMTAFDPRVGRLGNAIAQLISEFKKENNS